ncbi:MAG: SAM-dependent methyltransferase [Pedosphaera sp.]|nr:SAM-dependent methyltransferase [Pedosphaera sp.]
MAVESLIANERVEMLKDKLTRHPIYESVETLQDLRCFMEHHIYAVWDFMSLLKALQAAVAPAQTPWMPSPRPELRRFINEIVLGEECDEYNVDGTRRFISHFELYLLSMEEVKADTRPIREFIAVVNENGVEAALGLPIVPRPAIEFVRSTFQFIDEHKDHCTASAFAFGREDLIPAMFGALLERMKISEVMAPNFHHYLKRHTQLDAETHGPLALQLVAALCGKDDGREREARRAAEKALEARIVFWDGVEAAMKNQR